LSSLRAVLIAIVLPSAAVLAAGETVLTERRGQLACSNTLVTAQASCYANTLVCARETLTFHRPENRIIVASHPHSSEHPLIVLTPPRSSGHPPPADRNFKNVMAPDYSAFSWACVEGVNGGRYIAVVMGQTGGGNCGMCDYLRLYHPNGRLIASTLRFNAAGRPGKDEKAEALITEMIGSGPIALRPIYGQ